MKLAKNELSSFEKRRKARLIRTLAEDIAEVKALRMEEKMKKKELKDNYSADDIKRKDPFGFSKYWTGFNKKTILRRGKSADKKFKRLLKDDY